MRRRLRERSARLTSQWESEKTAILTIGKTKEEAEAARAAMADAERRNLFEREARVLALLNHPNIGAIYGTHDSDGARALVLELVEGETLADRIEQG